MNTLTKEQVEVLDEMESEFADEISDINSGAFATDGPEHAMAMINDIMALDARLDALRAAIATAAAYESLKAEHEALRAKVPDGWEPVTYEKGNIQINYNRQSFVVFDTEDECWLTPLGEWKLHPKERATFTSPTEAAKAAEKVSGK